MKEYNKNKEPPYLQCWDVSNLYGLTILQKLPVNNFQWNEDTSQLNEDFIKNYNEEIEIFLKLMFNILKNYIAFTMIYHFYLKGWRLKKLKSLQLIYMIKLNMLYQGSTIGLRCVHMYAYFYRHAHDFGNAYVDTYTHFFPMIFSKFSKFIWFL